MLYRKHACLLIFLFCTASYGDNAASSEQEKTIPARDPVVAAYLPDYAVGRIDVEQLKMQAMTDLIYFGMSVPPTDETPTYKPKPEHLDVLKKLQKRSDCRLLLCVGGWERSDGFGQIAATYERRKAFIDLLINLCEKHGFDGVDYDWEHPHGVDQITAFGLLVEETAKRFKEKNYIVTVAQSAWQNLDDRVYRNADRIHLMCYDQAYPHATMQHAKSEVKQLIDWGCPPEKITLGIPFYGRNKERQARAYRDLAQHVIDPATPNQIEGYAINGPALVADKTRWACEQGLAGVMIWELTQDTPEQSLLLTIKQTIRGVSCPTEASE